tara:strand:+ start:120932 stop:121033 length:102 start_codon:yes stop_codon:yes gene_type:complete
MALPSFDMGPLPADMIFEESIREAGTEIPAVDK